MFSTRLKTRAFWPIVERQLNSSPRWKFLKCSQNDSELSIPLKHLLGNLRVYMIPVEEETFAGPEQDIDQHLQDTHSTDLRMILLIGRPLDEEMSLQNEKKLADMQALLCKCHTPATIVLSPSPEHILRILEDFVNTVESSQAADPFNMNTLRSSLYASATVGIAQNGLGMDQAEMLLHNHGSLRQLRAALFHPKHRQELRHLLGSEVVTGMVNFWDDEWIL